MTRWFKTLEKLIEDGKVGTVVLLAHVRDKFITSKSGDTVMSTDIDLTGKVKGIYSTNSDAIGYMYAKGNKRVISFKSTSSEKVVSGNRSHYLSDKNIEISELNPESGEVTPNNKTSVTLNKEALDLLKIGNLRDRLRFAWDAAQSLLLVAGSIDDPTVKTFKLPLRKYDNSLKLYNKELYTSLKGVFGFRDANIAMLRIADEPLAVGEHYEDPTSIPVWMQDRTWYVVTTFESPKQ